MAEGDVIIRLREALTECGIPKDAVFHGMSVSVGSRRSYRADILVSADDKKTPLFVVEAKGNCVRRKAYEQARQQTAGLLGRCPCFVATSEGDVIYFARVESAMISDENWVRLKDRARMRQLLGDYSEESANAIDQNEPCSVQFSEQELRRFRIGLCVGGGIAIVAMFVFECATGRGVSYSLAGVVALVLVLYAASYGLVRELKIKDVGLSFGPCGGNNAEVA